MASVQSKAVKNHRARQRKRGIVRVEVQAPECDAALIRDIAAALRDEPGRAGPLRQRLRQALRRDTETSLREMLVCDLPDEVVDDALARPRDLGRDVLP